MVLFANIFMKIRLCNGEMFFSFSDLPGGFAYFLLECCQKHGSGLIRACIGHFGAACIMRQ